MSLDLGTLRGFLDLDDTPFEDALDKAGEKLKGFGGKGAKIAAGAGVAIAGALATSLVMNMNAEAANDKLAAQLGLTQGESARIGKAAGELYANNYGDSLESVNDAIKSVMQNIGGMRSASNADLEDVTKKAMNLATVFDQDVGGVTAAVGQMMKTGMAKNATEALDVLTKGFQGPANKADDLLDTFNEYGTQFRKLGLNGKEAMGLLQQGLQGGARDADIVADSIKEFSLRTTGALLKITQTKDGPKATLTALGQAFADAGYDATAGSKGFERASKLQEDIAAGGPKAKAGLGVLLDGLRATKDPLTRANNAVALFGTQAEDMGAALYSLDPSKAVSDLGKVTGAADKLDATLNDNAVSALESLKRQGQMAFMGLANKALPTVDKLAKFLSANLVPALKHTVAFLKDHKTAAAVLVGVIGALVVVTKAHQAAMAVSAAGGMLKWLQSTKLITAATKTWTAVQWLWNAAMSANPIGLILIALVALGAGLVIAYKKSETFRNIVNAAFHAVAEAGRWLWNSVLQPVFQFLVRGFAFVMDMYAKMLDGLSHVPGFGWAKTAADAMHHAADKARDLANNIKDIPPHKESTVSVVFRRTTINSVRNRVFNDPHGIIEGVGATGGIVNRPTVALIGEAGPEAVVPLNRTPGNAPLPAAGGAQGHTSLFRDLIVPAQPGADRSDVDQVVTSVVYHMGLAARSGRYAVAGG